MTREPHLQTDQELEGGDGSANLQAARDITGNVIVIQQGISEQRAREIYMELFNRNTATLVDDAAFTYRSRADQMGAAVVKELHDENPELLGRFREPRAQIGMLKAQQSFGETGDTELAPILSKTVAALIKSEPKSSTERVARRCIECVTNMTADHLYAIAVIYRIQRKWFPNAINVPELVQGLTGSLQPYFGQVPTERAEYDYMHTLGIGTLNQVALDGVSPYTIIRMMHPNAMYNGLSWSDIPENLRSLDLTPFLYRDSDTAYLKPDFANKWLKAKGNFFVLQPEDEPEDSTERALITLCRDRIISDAELKAQIRELNPGLAELLDTLDENDALGLQLNQVGVMLAEQEESLRNEGAQSPFLEDPSSA